MQYMLLIYLDEQGPERSPNGRSATGVDPATRA